MQRSSGYGLCLAAVALAVVSLVSAVPTPASATSTQAVQVTAAADQAGSWFSPWFYHRWPS